VIGAVVSGTVIVQVSSEPVRALPAATGARRPPPSTVQTAGHHLAPLVIFGGPAIIRHVCVWRSS
jgi:hypothetical protein